MGIPIHIVFSMLEDNSQQNDKTQEQHKVKIHYWHLLPSAKSTRAVIVYDASNSAVHLQRRRIEHSPSLPLTP
jgi:hypothetical protein